MKHSLNFGTDNIFFVPPGEALKIYDIYNWRIIELNIRKFKLYLNQSYLSVIKRDLTEARRRLQAKGAKINFAEVERRLEQFIAGFQLREFPCLQPQQAQIFLNALFAPQAITLWVRISDVPLESFFAEDYEEQQQLSSSQELLLPVNAALYLDCLQGYETALPLGEETESISFVLGLQAKDAVKFSSIPPLKFLPLAKDFCGAFGSSAEGILVNYTHHATISQQNLSAAPLYKVGSSHYVTLYFSLITKVECGIIFPLSVREGRSVVEKIKGAGFQLVKQEGENYIFRQGESIIHFYGSAPGKETLSISSFLPPFLLIAGNEASVSPTQRAKLLPLLTQLFPRGGKK